MSKFTYFDHYVNQPPIINKDVILQKGIQQKYLTPSELLHNSIGKLITYTDDDIKAIVLQSKPPQPDTVSSPTPDSVSTK